MMQDIFMFSSIGFLDDDTDDECENKTYIRARKRKVRDNSNLFEIPEIEFIKHFRFSRRVFKMILDEIEPHMKVSCRRTAVKPIHKLSAFLRFLATGSYQKIVGNEFIASMSQSMFSSVISECLTTFELHFCSKWINLNMSTAEEMEAKEHFNSKYEIPGVVGCVGGTHVRIKCPSEEIKHLYYNRKGFYSIKAMVICDHKLVVKFVDARHPGSSKDAFIWNASRAEMHFRTLHKSGKINTWLLGDSAYKLMPYLMTPFRKPTIQSEIRFNERQIKGHNTIEKCFGVLKSRFRCIIGERGLNYSPKKTTQIINVCCALHNACIFYKDNWTEVEEVSSNNDAEVEDVFRRKVSLEAIYIRRRLAESLI